MKYYLTLAAASLFLFACRPKQETTAPAQDTAKTDSSNTVYPDSALLPDVVSGSESEPDSVARVPVQKQVKKRHGHTMGKVSHRFRKTGCATVIIVSGKTEEDELVLIPRDALKNVFDVDGLIIYFNYLPLKMPNPPGCVKGMPAEISDVERE